MKTPRYLIIKRERNLYLTQYGSLFSDELSEAKIFDSLYLASDKLCELSRIDNATFQIEIL